MWKRKGVLKSRLVKEKVIGKKEEREMNNNKVISLFAGIGGIDQAFIQNGYEVIWANEIDKYACQTYRANFPNHKLVEGDIRQIEVENIPPHNVLIAGFPCQTFSLAQQNKQKQGLNDPRGHLFKEILRVLKYHKPSWFLLENVKGLTFKNNKQTFDLIIEGLTELGYRVSWKILNAKDFGVPQNRERVYIVGNRLDLDFEFPKPTNEPTKISDILEEKVDEKYYLSEKLWNTLVEHKERNQAKGNGFGYSLFTPDLSHTNTLRRRYVNDGSEILILQYRKRKDPNRDNWREYGENVPTLTSAMGMGGGNIPYVYKPWKP